MSIAIITTRGTFVIDLYLKLAPMNGFNFLKLCKLGYYNNSLFFEIQENFYIKIGHLDINNNRSIYSLLSNDKKLFVPDEISKQLTHSKSGLISTLNDSKNSNSSNFFITLGKDLSRFDSQRTIFGVISEGYSIIENISHEFVDKNFRPFRNIRILETIILFDPFDDPKGFNELEFKPFEKIIEIDRIEDNEILNEFDPEIEEKKIQERKKIQHSEILEIFGDIPNIELQPPETSLFICKLHPRTNEDGLKIIFNKFGKIEEINIIKDKLTGKSLCYGFINFSKPIEAENAYQKMQRSIIDNRMVIVDFCQSLKKSKKN